MEFPPLAFADVLELESVRLHGPGQELLPSRWTVDEEEILNARALLYKLAPRLAARTVRRPPRLLRWGKRRKKYEEDRKAAIDGFVQSWTRDNAPNTAALAEALNKLLSERRWLRDHEGFRELRRLPPFEKRRFFRSKLPPVTSFLPAGEEKSSVSAPAAAPAPAAAAAPAAEPAPAPDAVANLNRQMLEAVFPHELRPAAEARLGKVVDAIHQRARDGEPRRGLAISGGGIRSATFALGILQGLARRHILEKFDFLSTVSGGGYVGSWLSSWARRDQWGIRGVAAMLTARPEKRLDPEAPPIRHLRAYSNYLTPRLGALSADTWALVATYLRNLLLNWLVLVPLLVALVTVPRIALGAMMGRHSLDAVRAVGLAGLLTLGAGLVALLLQRPVLEDRRRRRLSDSKFIAVCIVPMLAAAFLLALAWAWNQQLPAGADERYELPLGGTVVTATAIGILGALWFAFQLRKRQKRRTTAAKVGEKGRSRRRDRIVWELVGSAIAGAIGGALLWLAATKAFAHSFDLEEAAPLQWAVRWAVSDRGALSAATAAYATLAPPLVLGLLFLQATLLIGIASKYNHDFDREWWARASGWVLIAALAWIVLCAVSIYGPVGIYYFPKLLTAIGGGAGLFSLLAGWSAKTKPKAAGPDEESTANKAISVALGLAVPLFGLFLIALVSLGTSKALRAWTGVPALPERGEIARQLRLAGNAVPKVPQTEEVGTRLVTVRDTLVSDLPRLRARQHLQILEKTGGQTASGLFLAAIVLGLVASYRIGVNVFSMHAMYRNRLVRAYLGASRWVREPNRFTGFDPRDNLDMHELRPEYVWWHSFHDANGALALLRGEGGKIDDGRRVALQAVHGELKKILTDRLDSVLHKEPAADVDIALIQALNTIIATGDLIPAARGAVGHEAIKPLRNRRYLEQAFGDALYPAPMPLLCLQDVNRAEDFVASYFASPAAADVGLPEIPKEQANDLVGRLNGVLLEGIPDALPAVEEKALAPFRVGNDQGGNLIGIPRLIRDRLRLDAALAGLVAPLQPAKAMHLVDICLNLTSGDQLAWQQRQAESFSVSPLAAGNPRLGYRETRWYGDVSLGTAVTISGAAASPNMGYHSSPALAFLMTLFNVRLGWWLGNPGIAGQRTYRARNPSSSLLPLLREATGNTNDAYSYVYLSDGGHFENLGLYELVQRRCHRIFVSDAGADPGYAYDDLGNAVRKIRVDLGIPVRVTRIGIIPPKEKKPGKYCAVGCIDYRAVDGDKAEPGEFLYVKPVVYQEDDDLPRDVFNYSRLSENFPHESTADQWFSESQFESYRRLGEYAIDQICQAVEGAPSKDCKAPDNPVRVDSLERLIEEAGKYLDRASKQQEAANKQLEETARQLARAAKELVDASKHPEAAGDPGALT